MWLNFLFLADAKSVPCTLKSQLVQQLCMTHCPSAKVCACIIAVNKTCCQRALSSCKLCKYLTQPVLRVINTAALAVNISR
jgi:hypothetical protein